MIGIIGFWSANQRNIQSGRDVDLQCWRETMKALGGTHLILVDSDGLGPIVNDQEITFEVFPTLQAALDNHPNKTFVFLEFEPNMPLGISYNDLKDFVHPIGNTFYVVGPDEGNLDLDNLFSQGYLTNNQVVTIKPPLTFGYAVSGWSHVIAAIALYDRLAKLDV